MGVELVEGQDLVVVDGALHDEDDAGPAARSTSIYRRIDDDFLDPLVFRSDSVLGVPGHLRRLSRRPRDDRQRAGRRHRRRQGDLQLHARDHRVLHRPRADPEERADLQCAASPTISPTCSSICPSSSSRRCTARAATACWSGPTASQRRDRHVPRQAQGAARQLHRPADAGALDLPDAGRSGHRRRATSTCARSCSSAIACGSRPGGLTRVALKRGLARRQLEPGRRHQGHLGPAGLNARARTLRNGESQTLACWDGRANDLYLAVALHRARREHGAPDRGRLPHRAFAARRRRDHDEEWRSTLASAGCAQGYFAKHESLNTRDVINYLLFDCDNSSSVYSCLSTARRNARAQRTALTREMWESLNSAWIEFGNIKPTQ